MKQNTSKVVGVLFMLGALLAPVSSLYAVVSLGSVTLTEVKCRIFTPNGDLHNDKARFEFDNPEQLPLQGTVYDVSGARVASLTPAARDPESVLLWDGKDTDGQIVAGGIYIYDIDFQGKHATGTVVVSR